MMIPHAASGYIVFAGNRMVVAANEGYEINSDNWQSKLLDPSATFDHHNPYAAIELSCLCFLLTTWKKHKKFYKN